MKYIVERETGDSHPHPGTVAFTGPMTSAAHACRERDAWIEAGHRARVIDYTADVAVKVRLWEKGQLSMYEDDDLVIT